MAKVGSGSLMEGISSSSVRAGGAAPEGLIARHKRLMTIASVAAIILATAFIGYNFVGGATAARESRARDLIDSELVDANGHPQPFLAFAVPVNESFPYLNPKTGKHTLYPVEKCFWTAEGKAKMTPTYVLLNQYSGKPGDTICPDCGRKVRGHNPAPPPELMSEAAEQGRN